MKNIVEHHYTYRLPKGEYHFNYRKMPCFWCKTHPLHRISELAIEYRQDFNDCFVELMMISNGMYRDFYNNGTGNKCYWDRREEFILALRQSGLPSNVKKSLQQRYSNVIQNISRGINFGWVRKGYEHDLALALENLLTDVYFYVCEKYLYNEKEMKIIHAKENIINF